jgi:hypothetical protein
MLVAASAATVLAIACVVGYVVDEKNDVSEPPSGNVDTSSSPLPTPPPHRKVTLFDQIELPYSNDWRGAMSDPGKVENIVDGTHCDLPAARCPHIMIYKMDGVKADPIKGDLCTTTVDQPASGDVKRKGTRPIGNKQADYYEQELCPMGNTGAPAVVRYTWDIPGKLRVVATNTMAPLALDDLNASLANVVWLK